MSGGARGAVPSHAWATWLAVVGAALVAVLIGWAVAVALPPIATNLRSEVSDGSTPVVLEGGGATADVVVPEGWLVLREASDAILVRTPDGVLSAHVDLVDATAESVVVGVAGLASPLRTEVLASGLTAVHADEASGAVIAGVEVERPVRTVRVAVELVPRADADVDPGAYRPAIAALLEGVQP